MRIRAYLNYFMILLSCFVSQGLWGQGCRLTQIIRMVGEQQDTTFYDWDSEGKHVIRASIAQEDGSHFDETYEYAEGELYAARSGIFTKVYFTGDKGRIEGYIIYDDLNVSNFYSTYEYDNVGKLRKHTMFHTPFLEDTVTVEYTTFQYKGNEMVQSDTYSDLPSDDPNPTTGMRYEYSKTPNPGYWPSTFPESIGPLLPSKVTYLSQGEPYDDYSFNRTCTTDKKGQPIQCTLTYPDGSPHSIETYVYDCK